MTLAGVLRPVGGGTCGGLVSTALMGSPCGGPKSPLREPPVVALEVAAASGVRSPQAARTAAAAIITSHFFIVRDPRGATGLIHELE